MTGPLTDVERLRAELVRAGHRAPALTLVDGVLTHPLAIAAGSALDGAPAVARCSPLRYRVHGVVGQGTTATVYRADAVTPNSTHRVALKVAHPHPYHHAVLARERGLLDPLRHPNLARPLGPALHPDGPALALAWGGVDLLAVLAAARARQAPLGVEVAVAVAVQLCDALVALGAAGIVHRRLTPDHVLVSEAGVVTLIGVSHAGGGPPMPVDPRPFDPEAPADPTMPFQARYLAPEQIRGGAGVGAAADVWATAVVASELVVGDHPITDEQEDTGAILAAVLGPVAPSPQLPPPVRELLQRALDHAATQRPTAAALGAALRAAAAAGHLAIGPADLARRLAAVGQFQ